MSSSASHTSSSYRLDLDGLRGVAIVLVVLYHVFIGRVSGGVDVFLMLSGFFFLGSQLRYATRPDASLNPWWPIWRMIRRLVPTLALVIAATVALMYFFTPQLLTHDFTRQITASLLYVLNWELISQEAAYAAASPDTSPLQHLWSMSVQGQFYLLAIAFAWLFAVLLRRHQRTAETVRNTAGPILIVVTVFSFAWACRHGLVGTPESYYSTWTRLWEMTLGGVLALYLPRLILPARVAAPAAAVGLLLILFTGLMIPTSLAFPGVAALLPVGGAALIVLSRGAGITGKILSSAPAVWLGKVAYPLYLWHWPLLIIGTMATGHASPPVWLGVAVLVASLLLADLTHRIVEKPLRQHAKRPLASENRAARAWTSLGSVPGALRAAGGALVAAVVAGLLAVHPTWTAYLTGVASEELDSERYPGALVAAGFPAPDVPPRPDPALMASIYPQPGEDGCMVFNNQPADFFPVEKTTGEPCVYGDAEADTIVVLAGGSHAEPWVEPLDVLGKQHGFAVIPFLRQQCPIVIDDDSEVYPACARWAALATEKIVDLDPDLVVSTSTRPMGEAGAGPDAVPVGYRNFWKVLEEADITFLGLRDNPWTVTPEGYADDANYCMLRHEEGGETYLGSEDPVVACSIPRDEVYAAVDPAARYLEHSIDTSDWFCIDEWCPPVVGNIPVYRDQNHISNAFALSTASLLWPYVQQALN